MADTYWAAAKTDEIAGKIHERVNAYYSFCSSSGLMDLWRRSHSAYYSGFYQGGVVGSGGEQDELLSVVVSHFRNLVQHLLVLTTSQRPAFEPKSTNTDHESQGQTLIARGLLDYYLRAKHLERSLKLSTESGLVYGEGFELTEWDASEGRPYGVDPQTGQVKHEGDLRYTSLTPLELARDMGKESWEDNQWSTVVKYRNRFDLVSRYPELADRIKKAPGKFDSVRYHYNAMWDRQISDHEGDDVAVYEFYHAPTDALPQGRLTRYLTEDTVLLDGPLPYKRFPIMRIAPGDRRFSALGYSPAFDLLPLQQIVDALYSTVSSNQSAFGVQNIAVPAGHDIGVQALKGGMNIITYDPKLGKPEPMQLTATAPETFRFMELIEGVMETISGVNSVARGNPEASLKSGAALALVQSMAVQFNSGLQSAWIQLLEDVGTFTIEVARERFQTERVITIVGKNKRSYLKKFTGADLAGIDRVTVDVGNPMSRTTAGRVGIADSLLQAGMLKTPEEYIQVINTGNLDPLLEGQTAELMLIRGENEALSEGRPVLVVATENHMLHIKEHASVLASPDAKESPQATQNALAHISAHVDQWRNMDPALAAALGMAPPPPALMPPTPAGMPPEEAQTEAPMDISQQMAPAQEPLPEMPSMPVNPLTGERAPTPQPPV